MDANVWIDLDNTPHVPFFIPIIRELEKCNVRVMLTARDAFQVCELANQRGLSFKKIGRHYGKNRLVKAAGLFYRAFQLIPTAIRCHPIVGISHGSRSQIITCNMLHIPSIALDDYEFGQSPPLMRPTWEIVPEAIPQESLCLPRRRVRRYPGIKENVYAVDFTPDRSIINTLGLDEKRIIVIVRPPATEAHYHNPEGEILFFEVMKCFSADENICIVLLPRNKKQEEWIHRQHPELLNKGRIKIPSNAVDGLNLLWHSDLVVSGGGTMNREAAALGVPVYSIFRGKTGAIDLLLEKQGKLVMIKSVEEVQSKIVLLKKEAKSRSLPTSRETINSIISAIFEIIRVYRPDSKL